MKRKSGLFTTRLHGTSRRTSFCLAPDRPAWKTYTARPKLTWKQLSEVWAVHTSINLKPAAVLMRSLLLWEQTGERAHDVTRCSKVHTGHLWNGLKRCPGVDLTVQLRAVQIKVQLADSQDWSNGAGGLCEAWLIIQAQVCSSYYSIGDFKPSDGREEDMRTGRAVPSNTFPNAVYTSHSLVMSFLSWQSLFG